VALECGAGSERARIGNKLRWAVWPSGPDRSYSDADDAVEMQRFASDVTRVESGGNCEQNGHVADATVGLRTIDERLLHRLTICAVAVLTRHSMSSSLTVNIARHDKAIC